MKRTLLIFNPAARGDKARHTRDVLYLRAAERRDVVLAPTTAPGEARQLAAQGVREGYDLIVAAGGDGTINEVVNGIGTSGVPLGVVPMGTINVFARELGIPLRMNDALTLLESGTERTIDLGCAEWDGKIRYFVQLAGVGLDAASVKETEFELKKYVGPLSYIWAGLKVLSRKNPAVEVDRQDSSPPLPGGSTVLIGNGRLYGGPFEIFPKALLDDGLLDVCVFQREGYLGVARYFQAILRGKHTEYPDVSYIQAAEFSCRGPVALPFEVDGELAGETPVRFSVKRKVLRVVVPTM